MWICRKCQEGVQFAEVKSEIDSDGLHFICPACASRNVLVNVAARGPATLMQPELEWPPGRPIVG